MITNKATLILLIAAYFCLSPIFAQAAQIENLPTTPVTSDYVIGPGKHELWLDPGKSEIRNLMVTNRYGRDMEFKIELEDFKGSRVPGENIILLGNEKGPYSLKDFIRPESISFVLKHGQRITMPIFIQVLADAQPGGLYGSVIVTARAVVDKNTAPDVVVSGNLTVISRLASLFFVRINGQANENGQLQNFSTDKHFYTQPDINFKTLYENNGNVYLNPYGLIEIKNILGDKIGEIKIDPYFVMPDAARARDFSFHRTFMFGRYQATIMQNLGYDNIIEEKTISFWVLPWRAVGIVVAVLILVVIGAFSFKQWFDTNFERKPKN